MQRAGQSGFTLFEITFAIAIMFLLVTIIMMGQDFTANSQVNRLEHDFRSIQNAVYDAGDGGRSIRGDVRKASLQLQGSADSGNGDSTVVSDGDWTSTSGETFKLWHNIRPASSAQGSTDAKPHAHALIKLAGGGVVGVSESYSAPIAGISGNYTICANGVAGRLAKKLDIVMDDGDTASGSMRVSNSAGGAAIAADGIVNGSTYMVCLGV